MRNLLETQSILGGQKVEGLVFKNYSRFGRDGKVLMGKLVHKEYRELQAKSWKSRHPGQRDILQNLIAALRTEARWNKGVQHLREAGLLEQSPRDIGPLITEVREDTKKECEDYVREQLFKWYWPKIQRAVTAGLPEWYKGKLLEWQFEQQGPVVELKAPGIGTSPGGKEEDAQQNEEETEHAE
jgi:hypothetical protein